MHFPPPEVFDTWPEPNYTNPLVRGHGTMIVNIICASLATIVTCLRVYTRLRITCTAGLDDLLIMFGLVFAVTMCVVTSLAAERYGWNRHMWDVPVDWLPSLSKLNLCFQMLFSLSSTFTKLSLLWFCRRLLGAGKGLNTTYNLSLLASMFFVALSSTLFLFLSLFQCRPIHAYWDLKPDYPYRCLDDGAIVFSASLINIFTDVAITFLPMPLIWNLKLPARQRIAVMSVFALGIVVDVAGSVRTVYVYKSMIADWDVTWLGWPVLPAAAVEIHMGLICASAPALRPLIAFFLPRLLGSSYVSTHRQSRSKPRTSMNTSRPSRVGSHQYGPRPGVPPNRLEVIRTVELKAWSDPRTSQDAIGTVYDISANTVHTPTRAAAYQLNNESGVLYISSSGDRSMESLTSDGKAGSFEEIESV